MKTIEQVERERAACYGRYIEYINDYEQICEVEEVEKCDGCDHYFDESELKPCRFYEEIGDFKTYHVCEKCHKDHLEDIEISRRFNESCDILLEKIEKLNYYKAS